jgi:hypothetical protein
MLNVLTGTSLIAMYSTQRQDDPGRRAAAGASGQREDPAGGPRDPDRVEAPADAQQRERERPEELQGHHGAQRDAGDRLVEDEVERYERGAERRGAEPEPPRAAVKRRADEREQQWCREREPQRPGARGSVDGEHGRGQGRGGLQRRAAGHDQQRSAEAVRGGRGPRRPARPERPASIPLGAGDCLHGSGGYGVRVAVLPTPCSAG